MTLLLEALRDPNVGSIAETSVAAARSICGRLNRRVPQVIVECGAGAGAITRQLVKTLHPASTIVAIESNPALADRLSEWNAARGDSGPRCSVRWDDAMRIDAILAESKIPSVDCILSGIPLSFFELESRLDLIDRFGAALTPEGNVLLYQASWSMRRHLATRFAAVDCWMCPFNLPPLFVMDARGWRVRRTICVRG